MIARPGRLVLLGHPVSHSLSPRFQNAALRAAGIPLVYEALDVPPGDLSVTAGAALGAFAAATQAVRIAEGKDAELELALARSPTIQLVVKDLPEEQVVEVTDGVTLVDVTAPVRAELFRPAFAVPTSARPKPIVAGATKVRGSTAVALKGTDRL